MYKISVQKQQSSYIIATNCEKMQQEKITPLALPVYNMKQLEKKSVRNKRGPFEENMN